MPRGAMVINYIVSCSQAVASQRKKKRKKKESKNLSGFICKYRSIEDRKIAVQTKVQLPAGI